MTKEAPTPARMAVEGPPLPPSLSFSPLLSSTVGSSVGVVVGLPLVVSLIGYDGVADGEMNEVTSRLSLFTKTVVLPATEDEEDRDADGVGFALSSVAVW